MRKLTDNQKNLLECLTDEFQQLKDISKKYGIIQYKKHGYSESGSVWKSEVSRVLNSLIKRGIVEYEYLGKYKLKTI